jgi:murein L,D-transpeptidase YcbB/YkuD
MQILRPCRLFRICFYIFFLGLTCPLTLDSHVRGCTNPAIIGSEWYLRCGNVASEPSYEIGLQEDLRVEESFSAPIYWEEEYPLLSLGLRRYRAIAANGGWLEVPEGIRLEKGDRNVDVPVLRHRLADSGGLTDEKNESDVFDEELEQAVISFQRRHGLKTDGVVGPLTVKALNVPAATRADQILVNIERLRWFSDNFSERYIYVNIADYKLDVIENGRPMLSMKVVVGKPYWNTPEFSAKMTYLIVNPSWNIPESIVAKETLRRIKKDPYYFEEQNITVLEGWGENTTVVDPATINWKGISANRLPYHFRQEPGPLNPLGSIKFMFPNKFNVYLHDTQAKGLFEKGVRTFSHGCIRIEKPFELARYLLKDNLKTGQEDIDQVVAKGEERIVSLERPIDVHIVYLTAWADEEGEIQFRDDVYGRDAGLRELLREESSNSGDDFPGQGEFTSPR